MNDKFLIVVDMQKDFIDGTWLNMFSLPAAGSGRFFKLALEVD